MHPIAALQTEYSLWTRDPEAALLTDDPPIAPSCVLPRETDDEGLDFAIDRWTAGPAMRVCPAARHQPLVPAQQRSRTE
jgi:hypothetical protein